VSSAVKQIHSQPLATGIANTQSAIHRQTYQVLYLYSSVKKRCNFETRLFDIRRYQ